MTTDQHKIEFQLRFTVQIELMPDSLATLKTTRSPKRNPVPASSGGSPALRNASANEKPTPTLEPAPSLESSGKSYFAAMRKAAGLEVPSPTKHP